MPSMIKKTICGVGVAGLLLTSVAIPAAAQQGQEITRPAPVERMVQRSQVRRIAPGAIQQRTIAPAAASAACVGTQQRHVLTIGTPDNFGGGTEPTVPHADVLATSNISTYLGRQNLTVTDPYDATRSNRWFADRFYQVPNGVASGSISIGLKANSNQSTDSMHLGNVKHFDRANASNRKLYGIGVPQMTANGWSQSGTVFSADLSTLTMGNGETLLDWVSAKRFMDVSVQDDTSVDFVTLDLCVNR